MHNYFPFLYNFVASNWSWKLEFTWNAPFELSSQRFPKKEDFQFTFAHNLSRLLSIFVLCLMIMILFCSWLGTLHKFADFINMNLLPIIDLPAPMSNPL